MFKLTWSASSETESTAIPAIKRMELYGEIPQNDRNQ